MIKCNNIEESDIKWTYIEVQDGSFYGKNNWMNKTLFLKIFLVLIVLYFSFIFLSICLHHVLLSFPILYFIKRSIYTLQVVGLQMNIHYEHSGIFIHVFFFFFFIIEFHWCYVMHHKHAHIDPASLYVYACGWTHAKMGLTTCCNHHLLSCFLFPSGSKWQQGFLLNPLESSPALYNNHHQQLANLTVPSLDAACRLVFRWKGINNALPALVSSWRALWVPSIWAFTSH